MDIPTATPGDPDEVFDLLSLQSRAAFGVSDVVTAERARARSFDCLRAVVASGDEPFVAFVERAGFQGEGELLRRWRRFDDDLPAPTRLDGVSVRTYAAADGEAVHALLDRAYWVKVL